MKGEAFNFLAGSEGDGGVGWTGRQTHRCDLYENMRCGDPFYFIGFYGLATEIMTQSIL